MPMYEYKCEACEKVFEKRRKFEGSETETCKECGIVCDKLVSESAFALKGFGWALDRYSKSQKQKNIDNKR